MLVLLQSTVLRWAAEIMVQQLVIQIVARLVGQAQPQPQLVAERTEAQMFCHQCGRRIRRVAASPSRRRVSTRKRSPTVAVIKT